MAEAQDLTGMKFNRWTVVERVGRLGTSRSTNAYYRCRCECGTMNQFILSTNLTRGKSKGCSVCAAKGRPRTRWAAIDRQDPEQLAAKQLYSRHKQDDKVRGYGCLPFEVWNELRKKACHYCGAAPTPRSPYKYGRHPEEWKNEVTCVANGIDRKDNARGYEPDNCVSCCLRCNRIKMHHLSYVEMLLLVPGLQAIEAQRLVSNP